MTPMKHQIASPPPRRTISFRKIEVLAFVLIASLGTDNVYAHGGGGPSSKEPTHEKSVIQKQIRVKPKRPAALSSLEIQRILSQEVVAEDVLVIRCMLSSVAPCRGVALGVFDRSGNKVLMGHSGLIGYMVIEGLDPTQSYTLEIESKKYQGSIESHPGTSIVLNGALKR